MKLDLEYKLSILGYSKHTEHLYAVRGGLGGLSAWVSESLTGGEPAGGLEFHYRRPPADRLHDTPSHHTCWLLHAPCWHIFLPERNRGFWIQT